MSGHIQALIRPDTGSHHVIFFFACIVVFFFFLCTYRLGDLLKQVIFPQTLRMNPLLRMRMALMTTLSIQ